MTNKGYQRNHNKKYFVKFVKTFLQTLLYSLRSANNKKSYTWTYFT